MKKNSNVLGKIWPYEKSLEKVKSEIIMINFLSEFKNLIIINSPNGVRRKPSWSILLPAWRKKAPFADFNKSGRRFLHFSKKNEEKIKMYLDKKIAV